MGKTKPTCRGGGNTWWRKIRVTTAVRNH